MGPNLFEFATTELSQDAVLAWLLARADQQYNSTDPRLHALAQRFLFALVKLDKTNPEPLDHSSVKVRSKRMAARIGRRLARKACPLDRLL
jgi:hypothetical protein